jgi:hypothetical protein
MTATDFHRSLHTLLHELTFGATPTGGFVLNPADKGLLASLDALTADDASLSSQGGATIAAHVDHVTYGLSLMNRWAAGENPFGTADWSAAWTTGRVSDADWARLRRTLREQVDRWLATIQQPREMADVELNGVMASVVHLAYHLGAIRQVHTGLRGPKDSAPA